MILDEIVYAKRRPKSLIDGVEQAVVEILGITDLRHRSALRRIPELDRLVGAQNGGGGC